MTRTKFRVFSLLCASLAVGGTAFAQSTATQNLAINSGSFEGALNGSVSLQIKNQTSSGPLVQTRGILSVTDLDITTTPTSGPGINAMPSVNSQNNTASTFINLSPTTIGINIANTQFNNGVTGNLEITAGDNFADGISGVLDPGVPGSDGAWDDPGATGILNNATLDEASLTLTGGISAPASVSGVINASIPSNVTIPNVVSSGIFAGDLILKNSSTMQISFAPAQNVSIQNLTMTTQAVIPLTTETAGNFTDGNHPVPGATTMLDLSTAGGDLVSTRIAGNLVMDVQGTLSASIDLALALKLNLSSIGLGTFNLTTFDMNDVINGPLSSGSLLQINEEISLDDTELPFILDVRHNAGTDVDFDDVIAELLSGTLGFSVPIPLTETDVVLALPATPFLITNQSFSINQRVINLPFGDAGDTFVRGNVNMQRLEGNLTGNVVMDINANLNLSAELLATALGEASINVFAPVPEPSSIMLAAAGFVGLMGFAARRRRR